MHTRCFLFLICSVAVSALPPSLTSMVEASAMSGDFAAAEKILGLYRGQAGVTPEYIEALSWVGRGRLSRHQAAAAEANGAEVRSLCLAQLAHRKLDAEAHLPIALGAAVEVQAQALAQDSQRDQAVLFLRDELKRWQGTSVVNRIQKNLNLLTLEGKPAPLLDVAQGIGEVKPVPLSAHRGHPVLLFLWAHWCVDCKAEAAIVERLKTVYGPRGLVVVAPTQRYGFAAGGKDAGPAEETKYIEEIFRKYYAGLGKVEAPLSERNFKTFGVSTTPTMVLIDGGGVVRLYNPGAAAYDALAARIDALLLPPPKSLQKSL